MMIVCLPECAIIYCVCLAYCVAFVNVAYTPPPPLVPICMAIRYFIAVVRVINSFLRLSLRVNRELIDSVSSRAAGS